MRWKVPLLLLLGALLAAGALLPSGVGGGMVGTDPGPETTPAPPGPNPDPTDEVQDVPAGGSEPATSTTGPPGGPFPAPGQAFVGVFTEAGPHDLADTDAFVEATGTTPAVHEFGAGFAHGDFDRRLFDALAERGMMPMLAWEPWDYRAPVPRTDQPDYQLSDIIDGRYDSYITSWARGIADLGYPVAIRFAHEMNGDWYPWSEQVNGNQRGEYVRAYRHVHDIFTQVGAENVTWVWSPNVNFAGSAPFEQYYPGDEYVDWLGLVGYYQPGAESFDAIYGDSIAAMARLADKPVVITEIGAPDTTRRQQEWIRDMFDALPRYPSVIGFVWFEVEIDADWRLASSHESARLFGAEAADDRYAVTWGPRSRPVATSPR